jgi:hypothetical protein
MSIKNDKKNKHFQKTNIKFEKNQGKQLLHKTFAIIKKCGKNTKTKLCVLHCFLITA